ncbi:MAG: hypothetical protein ACO394_12045 [Blastocatellia bacterium]
MAYAVGSLVQARGREWVVLPGSAEDLLLVRPLGGTEEEVTGLLTGCCRSFRSSTSAA